MSHLFITTNKGDFMSLFSVVHNGVNVKYVYALNINGKVTWHERLSEVIEVYQSLPFSITQKKKPIEIAEILLENGNFKVIILKNKKLDVITITYAMTNGSF